MRLFGTDGGVQFFAAGSTRRGDRACVAFDCLTATKGRSSSDEDVGVGVRRLDDALAALLLLSFCRFFGFVFRFPNLCSHRSYVVWNPGAAS